MNITGDRYLISYDPLDQQVNFEGEPEVIIWHLGLTSFLYQSIPVNLNVPIIGLFSSPVYNLQEVARLGLAKLLRNHRFVRVHLAGSLIPIWPLRACALEDRMHSLVVSD